MKALSLVVALFVVILAIGGCTNTTKTALNVQEGDHGIEVDGQHRLALKADDRYEIRSDSACIWIGRGRDLVTFAGGKGVVFLPKGSEIVGLDSGQRYILSGTTAVNVIDFRGKPRKDGTNADVAVSCPGPQDSKGEDGHPGPQHSTRYWKIYNKVLRDGGSASVAASVAEADEMYPGPEGLKGAEGPQGPPKPGKIKVRVEEHWLYPTARP